MSWANDSIWEDDGVPLEDPIAMQLRQLHQNLTAAVSHGGVYQADEKRVNIGDKRYTVPEAVSMILDSKRSYWDLKDLNRVINSINNDAGCFLSGAKRTKCWPVTSEEVTVLMDLLKKVYF